MLQLHFFKWAAHPWPKVTFEFFSVFVTGTYWYCCPHFLKSFFFLRKLTSFCSFQNLIVSSTPFICKIPYNHIRNVKWNWKSYACLNQTRPNIPTWHSNKFSVIDCPIQTSGAFYYFVYCSTSILECQSKGFKILDFFGFLFLFVCQIILFI